MVAIEKTTIIIINVKINTTIYSEKLSMGQLHCRQRHYMPHIQNEVCETDYFRDILYNSVDGSISFKMSMVCSVKK